MPKVGSLKPGDFFICEGASSVFLKLSRGKVVSLETFDFVIINEDHEVHVIQSMQITFLRGESNDP